MTSTFDTGQTLAAIAGLLEHASEQAYAVADATGGHSPGHFFALGVYLAACEAAELVPNGSARADSPLSNDPVALLRAAEELLRDVPIGPETPGVSHLVVTICDLIREAPTPQEQS